MRVVIFLTCLISVILGCPAPEKLYPCTCKGPDNLEDDSDITCSHLNNEYVLLNAVDSIRGFKHIHSFIIENSNLQYIPSQTFSKTRLTEIEIRNSSLMSLSDTDVAFSGLEDHLEWLFLINCSYMNEFDWSVLKNLRALSRIHITGSDMVSIEEDIQLINLTGNVDITFSNNKISYIHDSGFAKFKDLWILDLSYNEIKVLERSMLPNPADKLVQLDISHNKIEELPADLFLNMSKLEFVTISSNRILLLEEDTFSPIWETLEGFAALDNDLRCDCRLTWITKMKRPEDLRALCGQPPELRGTNLKYITQRDLMCLRQEALD